MTIAEAFEVYLAECGIEALPPGTDRFVAECAFYCGAIKATERIINHSATADIAKLECLMISVEVVAWLRENFPGMVN